MGVPQESSLGPILWLALVNSVFSLTNDPNIEILAFADDILILTIFYKFDEIGTDILQTFLNWARNNRLEFSNDKTQCITFLKGAHLHSRLPSIKMELPNNRNIKSTTTLKYLGIIPDPKPTCMAHLDHVYEKVANFTHKIKQFSRATWGLTPVSLKTIYKSCIER